MGDDDDDDVDDDDDDDDDDDIVLYWLHYSCVTHQALPHCRGL